MKPIVIRSLLILALCMAVAGIFYFLTAVDLTITDSDRKVFAEVPALSQCKQSRDSLPGIVECVHNVQAWLFEKIPTMNCTEPAPFEMQPQEVIDNHQGCCYGRSAFIGKFLQYAGLEIRHVGIWLRVPHPPFNLLKKRTPSHSLLEVRTPSGWMLVGTFSRYIGIDDQGHVLDATKFRDTYLKGAAEMEFLRDNGFGNFSIVYGIYSRHGYFYKPFVPLPDIAWAQFLGSLFDSSL